MSWKPDVMLGKLVMEGGVKNDDYWGQARIKARTLGRRLHIGMAVLAMLALPFLLDAGSRLYLNMGGAMPGGGFPVWLPLCFWVAEMAVAASAANLVFRRSDEFERQALVEGTAVGGSVLFLLLPPLFFMGELFGSHHGEALLATWAVAIFSGALTYRALIKRRWA